MNIDWANVVVIVERDVVGRSGGRGRRLNKRSILQIESCNLIVGINTKKVTSINFGSPRAKTDKNGAAGRDEVCFFVFRAKFAANMTNRVFMKNLFM